jgi:hypothetical protein
MYGQRDAAGSASELASVACGNAFGTTIRKIDDRTRSSGVDQNVDWGVVQQPDKLQMADLVANERVSVKTVLRKEFG